ncbi:MAG: hypothetical protein WBA43_14345 [Elainellaceae cyanobacterium]
MVAQAAGYGLMGNLTKAKPEREVDDVRVSDLHILGDDDYLQAEQGSLMGVAESQDDGR